MSGILPDLNLTSGGEIPANFNHEIRLFCLVRDEALRLPYFLEYYRKLGVDRFIFVNNDSVDETAEFLSAQKDCHQFFTKASFAKSNYGMDWTNYLLNAYGAGHWVLVADADELFVFPDCEKKTLKSFCHWLDKSNYEGVFSLMLDMYSKLPLQSVNYKAGENFLTVCDYHDKNYYEVRRYNFSFSRLFGECAFPPKEFIGGPRLRLCFAAQNTQKLFPRLIVKLLYRFNNVLEKCGLPRVWPHLIPAIQSYKIPLVRWSVNKKYINSHRTTALRLAPVTGALLHFKYFQDFSEKISHAVHAKNHFGASGEYAKYAQLLAQEPNLVLTYSGSQKYVDSSGLVRLGLMQQNADWLNTDWANENAN